MLGATLHLFVALLPAVRAAEPGGLQHTTAGCTPSLGRCRAAAGVRLKLGKFLHNLGVDPGGGGELEKIVLGEAGDVGVPGGGVGEGEEEAVDHPLW